MSDIYIGVLTGTSADAINAAAFSFGERVETVATRTEALPENIRNASLTRQKTPLSAEQFADISVEIGLCFAKAVNELIRQSSIPREQIQAVGVHGQTIFHRPDKKLPITLQAMDANIVCAETGLVAVDDFRRADMAVGGQGAPLASAFHQFAFSHPDKQRAVVNIGGIANITVLQRRVSVSGFDCGPGNTLMDYWIRTSLGQRYDENGQWAATAKHDRALLNSLLTHPFLSQTPPKSACVSDFGGKWLSDTLQPLDLEAAVVQATFTELTAVCIADAIQAHAPATEELFLCGGGTHNQTLVKRIQQRLEPLPIRTTDEIGLDADWVETALFAWLAKRRIEQQALELGAITGAEKPAILGAVYAPPPNKTI